jgi:DNA-binding CsgD family transcriptional regulator
MRPSTITEEQKEEIKRLAAEGKKPKEIGDRVRIKPTTIHMFLTHHVDGYQTSPTGRK